MQMRSCSILLLVLAAAACGQPATNPQPAPYRVHIRFEAADSLAQAAAQYDSVWRSDGERMVAIMERRAGMAFVSDKYADTNIVANVREVASNSGYRDSPMTMRASYGAETKAATLMHELGHRLMSGLFKRDEEEHNYLFLWLYDAWVEMYGQRFADAQVAIEKARGKRYVDAWDSALTGDAADRARRWREIREERMPTRR